MNTKMINIAQLLAATIWADGEYDEAERIAVNEIADALEYDEAEFNAAIDAPTLSIDNGTSFAKVTELDEEAIGNYIVDAAEAIDAEEAEMIFEVVLQLIISDNVISPSEISTAIAIAEALEIETEMAILLLLDMVKTEPELEIDFE